MSHIPTSVNSSHSTDKTEVVERTKRRAQVKNNLVGYFLTTLLLSTLQTAGIFNRSHRLLISKARFANVAFIRRVPTMFNDSFCDRSDSQAHIVEFETRLPLRHSRFLSQRPTQIALNLIQSGKVPQSFRDVSLVDDRCYRNNSSGI